MKNIAFFDFDGTIYNGDSMLDFARILHGKKFVSKALFKSLPNLILKRLKLRSSQAPKEQFLGYCLSNKTPKELNSAVKQFTALIEKKLFETAKNQINILRQSETKMVIVSASCGLWLQKWCTENDFDLIASQLELENGKYTGKLIGKNCKGPEKVKRIVEVYDLTQYEKVYAYGNDSSDNHMISLANQATKALYT